MLHLWLLIKRVAILLPGIAVAYASERVIFPYVHQRLSVAPAILATYIIGAYLLVPAIMRLWHLVVRPKHLPVYCVSPDGLASDPLNIGIIGTRKQLVEAMEAAGWSVAKPTTLRSIAATAWAILLNRPYEGMPMTPLYLYGRRQDIGFELQVPEKGRGYRHHVRFWATTLSDIRADSTYAAQNQKESALDDRLLWAGAASLDAGISIVLHTLQLTHAVDPNTNQERTLIVRQLEENGCATLIETIRLHKAYSLVNRTWFNVLKTDGKMAILKLN